MLRCFSWASAAWQAAKRELKLSLGRLLTAEFPPLVRKLSLFQAACICLQAGRAQAAQSIPFILCVFLSLANMCPDQFPLPVVLIFFLCHIAVPARLRPFKQTSLMCRYMQPCRAG